MFIEQIERLYRQFIVPSVDVPSDLHRAIERRRRVIWTAAGSVVARMITSVTAIVAIPLALEYLGAERYGLWLTLGSIVSILSFADFGIGNGLINAVANGDGLEDYSGISQSISSAFYLLLSIAVVIGLLFAFVYRWIPWPRLFNVTSPQAMAESGQAVFVFVVCILIGLPSGVVQKIKIGFQEGFHNALWLTAGSLLGFAGMLLAIRFRASLPWLIFAMVGAPVITNIVYSAVVFGWSRPWVCPRIRLMSISSCRTLMNVGVWFFLLQLASVIAYQTDNLVISHILGPEYVPMYVVPLRLFTLAPMLLGFILVALWPAYREAIARGDIAWVRRALRNSFLVGIVINLPITLLLLIFGDQIIARWASADIAPLWPLRLAMAIWAMINVIGGATTSFLNGIGLIRFQAIAAGLMAITNLVLTIVLTRHFGIVGPIYGTVIAYLIVSLAPSLVMTHRAIDGMAVVASGVADCK